MTTIKAHFDGSVFVPDEPVALEKDQRVTLHVDAPASTDHSRAPEELLKQLDKLAEMAKESNAPEADWSRDSIYSGNLDDPR